jgi:hypothetical protein
VNLLTYPGFTDCPSETDALLDFLKRGQVQMVQVRTLNMDRELLEEKVGFPPERGAGIEVMLDRLRGAGFDLGSRTPFAGPVRELVS